MRVGVLGVGKIGLPIAAAIKSRGHEVVGFDVKSYVGGKHNEAGLSDLLHEVDGIEMVETVEGLVRRSHLVLITVQTPHEPAYDGSAPAEVEPADFEYGYLVHAFRQVRDAVASCGRSPTVVVVSTVLPGTCARLLRTDGAFPFAYAPSFIAMGTTIADFLNPEFTIVGSEDPEAIAVCREFFRSIHDRPILVMDVADAEMTKVAYNTFIGLKIVFANALAEICDATGADVDAVTLALRMADQRIVSGEYLRAGMGDGGACHPRDNYALSALARKHRLSFDLFGMLMQAREAQSARLADLVRHWQRLTGLPVAVLGKAYKSESDLTDGSPASLLVRQLGDVDAWWDPYLDGPEVPLDPSPYVVVIATDHAAFRGMDFVTGSVVIDPWGNYRAQQAGVTVVSPGRRY